MRAGGAALGHWREGVSPAGLRHPPACPPLLRVVDKWENIGTADGLELLSATFAGTIHPRRFAVQALKNISDEELSSILLQGMPL